MYIYMSEEMDMIRFQISLTAQKKQRTNGTNITMTTEQEQQSSSSVGRWRTCCLPFDLCIQSRWTGLSVGIVFVTTFIVICFLTATAWMNLLANSCDVLQGNYDARCFFSLIYIIGVPLVIGVYVLFFPVLLYRIGRQNEEEKRSVDLEAPDSPYREVGE